MKKLLFLFMLKINCAGVAAQEGIDLGYMGKNIESYKGRLYCAIGEFGHLPESDSTVCVRYGMLDDALKLNKSFSVGNLPNFSLYFSTDSTGIIDEMMYMKHFDKKIKGSRVADSTKSCFDQLTVFFNNYCNAEAKTTIDRDDDFSLEKTARWNKDRYQFILYLVNDKKKRGNTVLWE